MTTTINGTNANNYIDRSTSKTSLKINGLAGDDEIFTGRTSDIINGGDGNDTLNGGSGNDTLTGNAGSDRLYGGSGNDTYFLDSESDLIYDTYGGQDMVIASFDYILDSQIENLTLTGFAISGEGNYSNNLIKGNSQDNLLNGLEGKDTLLGGLGNDVYVVAMGQSGEYSADLKIFHDDKVIELADQGNDTIQVRAGFTGVNDVDVINIVINASLTANIENLDMSGLSADSGVNLMLNILGNRSANILTGNDGDNVLDGGVGTKGLQAIDTLRGGNGDDTYIVDILLHENNVLIQDEIFDESGYNTLKFRGNLNLSAFVDYALTEVFSNIDVSATGTTKFNLIGNYLSNRLVGNANNNLIDGADGDDTLIGGLGKDILIGGAGSDYYVLSAGDEIIESEGVFGEIDTAATLVSVDLTKLGLISSGFYEIENISLLGKSNINATANGLDNTIKGNAGANFLLGLSGNDSIYGFNGADIIDGGYGADTMEGGFGNDTYIVDNEYDIIYEEGLTEVRFSYAGAYGGYGGFYTELVDLDIDTVRSSITYDLTNVSNIERLTLIGTDHIDGVGNAHNNLLTGNVANNVLNGAYGTDKLVGGKGDDTYIVALRQTNDNDETARVKFEDSVAEKVNEGFDTLIIEGDFSNLYSTTKLVLTENVEKLDASATGQTLLTIIGNALNNYIIGNDIGNILDGASGNDTIEAGGRDTLKGGAGNDTYILTDVVNEDVIVELANAGNDTLMIAVSYDLNNIANLENLTLTGLSNINGTGNKVANYLIGNEGNNTLTGNLGNDTLAGGLGADTLIGGLGNDVYVLQDLEDTLTENANEGSDSIQTEVSLSLLDYSEIEHLTLLGAADINATGNAAANLLKGNSAINILTGGAGVDTLQGGDGGDTYHVNLTQTNANSLTATLKLEDVIIEMRNQGNDTIILDNALVLSKATTLTLAVNIEHLDASATGASLIHLTGNVLNNQLTGNEFANIIQGGEGNDTLSGGDGVDSLFGGAGNDELNGNSHADIFVFNTALNASTNVDTINDFETGADKIQLSKLIFTKLVGPKGNAHVGELNVDHFVLGTVTTDANDYIIYDSTTGNLYYDATGNTGAPAVLIANLGAGTTLAYTDFTVL